MKITEVTSAARKVIKYLQQSYLSYTLGKLSYTTMASRIEQYIDNADSDIARESKIIQDKMYQELIEILRK